MEEATEMAGVERLQQLLEHSSKAMNAMEVSNLVDACMELMRDNNFRVSQGALQALASAAALSGDHLKLHFNALLPAIVERLGDAKQPVRDAARRLLLALMQNVGTGSVRQQLSKLIKESLKSTLPDESNLEPLIAVCTAKFGDYQCNNAMGIWSKIKGKTTEFKNPNSIGQAIMKNLPLSDMIEKSSVAGPGFVNIVLSNLWIAEFGMLIEYLFEEFPNWEEVGEQPIEDLQSFYKASKVKFDNDPAFKKRAQEAVVRLQGGEVKYHKAWKQICDISRNEFDQIYKRLKIQLEEKGESFYGPYIPSVLQELEDKGLIETHQGAKVIFVGKEKRLIVVKTDGGFNYASTDLAALWYRLNEEKAQWIIYVTDVGQLEHFQALFTAAKRAGWIPVDNGVPYPKASHVGLGMVHGNDGKSFRTCSSEVVRLADLLDEAKNRSKQGLIDRGRENEWTAEELENAAEAIGYGAVKYAELNNNRLTNYTFNFDQMLDVKGNTAVYLLYAHARICSIIWKSGKDIDELKKTGSIQLKHDNERHLGLHLIQFSEIVEDACTDLLPNTLCEYLYNLSEHFTKFYATCKVVGSEEETSRLLLCEATAIVMRECFKLLGITPLYKL